MKKIFLLFFVSVLIASCSSDDDSVSVNTQDKLIGSWNITQLFENGVEEMLTSCDLKDMFDVTADQKFKITSYDTINGDCTIIEETIDGTWENIGNNVYKLKEGVEVETAIEAKITFSENTMTFEFSDEIGDVKKVYVRN
ncbi:lipocalin family protein [Aquimarina sp. RZ0]|uniref:lipocalin family protein n=1 Tax=Aquimarina sp. RZ0 TaxID=2607730 RepID=UPI0011F16564|nr:lipocalin family protein [Aquimarina sp. RZ0]KAA1246850.1 lipocalin family protein [Aquimarina sp. RZ0]